MQLFEIEKTSPLPDLFAWATLYFGAFWNVSAVSVENNTAQRWNHLRFCESCSRFVALRNRKRKSEKISPKLKQIEPRFWPFFAWKTPRHRLEKVSKISSQKSRSILSRNPKTKEPWAPGNPKCLRRVRVLCYHIAWLNWTEPANFEPIFCPKNGIDFRKWWRLSVGRDPWLILSRGFSSESLEKSVKIDRETEASSGAKWRSCCSKHALCKSAVSAGDGRPEIGAVLEQKGKFWRWSVLLFKRIFQHWNFGRHFREEFIQQI